MCGIVHVFGLILHFWSQTVFTLNTKTRAVKKNYCTERRPFGGAEYSYCCSHIIVPQVQFFVMGDEGVSDCRVCVYRTISHAGILNQTCHVLTAL